MDLLPLKVLNKIAKNRTLYVRAASTTVSVGWRGSCNKNWMWWQHYNADTAEYLEAAECRVEPRFESQESEDSTLTCLYKRAGDKEISIKESFTKYNRKNRTLYVLAASSSVNVAWREYLETSECRVDTRFESQESEDSTQTSLYKKAGDKEISIKESFTKYNRKNRTLYVLAASSSVNVAWREYLETSECRVDPRFESQESEDSTQTSLYKKAGDKEISINESLTKYNRRDSDNIPIISVYRYCGLERCLQPQPDQNTWRLQSVEWSRGLSLRIRKTARRLVSIRKLDIKKSL
ncbi:hypothetical protein J6590_083211 [Homalodisca vitripennis]|nr:hypothetical protein J6590_083211 [Homalodisca vitripennis]